jgi:CheY-like chemotaxis protein
MSPKINKQSDEYRGTILIADDEPAILVLIRTILTAAGHRVLLACGGEDAIRLAGQKHLHIDAALLDIHMPGVQHAELAAGIRSLRPETPILFMSGLVDDEIIRIRSLEGYAGFLAKPLQPDCLLRTVRQAIAEPASVGRRPAGGGVLQQRTVALDGIAPWRGHPCQGPGLDDWRLPWVRNKFPRSTLNLSWQTPATSDRFYAAVRTRRFSRKATRPTSFSMYKKAASSLP